MTRNTPAAARRAPRPSVLALVLALAAGPAAAAPKVVATIAPIHSLVAGVMQGIATPALLLPGAASPHSYALKPSDARRLAGADLIVTVGPALEAFLARPLAHLGRNARVVVLMRDAGIAPLATSDGADDDPEHAHDPHVANPHVWLDPANAGRIVAHVATVLGEIDPANRARYRANAAASRARLGALDRALEAGFAGIREVPFMVSHDAYAYLVKRYRLNMAGVFQRTPEQAAGGRRLAELYARIARLGVRCVFSEPQFTSRAVAAAIRRTGVRAAVLDPLGAGIKPGPDAYGILMRRLADALVGCLASG